MIFLNINNSGAESEYLYQQIYEGIKTNILELRIKANEKLPSKRELATHLKVSINTITNAYEQLLAEGYIYTIERSGYYVEDIIRFNHQKGKASTILPSDLREEPVDKEGWISFSHMTSDTSLFPFKEWMKSQQRAISNHKTELGEITHLQGPYIVRKTISRLIALNRGVICEPEQIVISAGTQPLVSQLMSMQKKNTVIAVEDPGYSRIHALLSRMKFNIRHIPLDEKGINMKEVKASKANFLFVTPSHQFPTGKIMPISRRIQLLNWSTKSKNRYIIEDDYDSEFKYRTDSIPSLQSLDKNQRVIYTGTFSKTLLPSLRISYMVLPIDMLRAYRNRFSDLIQYNNTLSLLTLHYFIEKGAYAKHIKKMNNHYEMKRRYLIKQLKSRFEHDVVIEDIPAGLHFLAKFKTDIGYEALEERAKKHKLEVYSMKRFMLGNEVKERNEIDLIIGFANVYKEQIPEAVERLYKIIRDSPPR